MNEKLKVFVLNEEGFPEITLDIDKQETVELIKKHKDSSRIMFMNENEELVLLVSYGEIVGCEYTEWEMELKEELNN